jgi:hypothetical protein
MEIRSGGGGDNVRVVVVSQSPSSTVFTSVVVRAGKQSSTCETVNFLLDEAAEKVRKHSRIAFQIT